MYIRMTEPTDPEERALAIKICRVNAYLDPETAEPLKKEDARKLWDNLPDLAYSKWIWMWNEGKDEWEPK